MIEWRKGAVENKSQSSWRSGHGNWNSQDKRIIKTKTEKSEEGIKEHYQPSEKATHRQRGTAQPFNFCSINVQNARKTTTTVKYKRKQPYVDLITHTCCMKDVSYHKCTSHYVNENVRTVYVIYEITYISIMICLH